MKLYRIPDTTFIVWFAFAVITGCTGKPDIQNTPIEEVAGSDEVAAFMETFEGLGALSDHSLPTPSQDALRTFTVADDLVLDLVLAEPAVTQPVHISFDHRGRLWVVQYNQYPYPKGLKVTSLDQYLRATFDKSPAPPPHATKGADKITVFEDTDGDGIFDTSRDVITGLNITTSVAVGRGHIWVLTPPYLVAYPDKDDDGVPDGKPAVHLEGFGIEDTHAVANSLSWGPDGWLYGVQGSTCTANVSSAVSKNVSFKGQGVWRYHPDSKVFEIYAEGGGNTFHLEIDEKGRFYSGHNGVERGQYYKQGGYYIKNMDKHGSFTNPYAFGFLPNMHLEGDKRRFTHAFIKYEESMLPQRYQGKMIALNPLQNFVQLSTFEPRGSGFGNTDLERMVTTTDKWFRPVDIKPGPDGAVYIADWYDSRLSHVDPRDTWHKTSGRIYRLRSKDNRAGYSSVRLHTLSGKELVKKLRASNRWIRQQALRIIGEKRDVSILPQLQKILHSSGGQTALEALWAIHLCQQLNDETSGAALAHPDPYVRMWAVRLLGDKPEVSVVSSEALLALSRTERHPEVRSQLAATSKRLPAPLAFGIIEGLLHSDDDTDDPDIPLQIWWALEDKAETDRERLVRLFADPNIWQQPVVRNVLLKFLMQRYVMAGGAENFAAAALLLRQAPNPLLAKPLILGLQDAIQGSSNIRLPELLLQALSPFTTAYKKEITAVYLRQGRSDAVKEALRLITNDRAPLGDRIFYTKIFGEINEPAAVETLLYLAEQENAPNNLRIAALQALPRYDHAEIGTRIVQVFPQKLQPDSGLRNAAYALFSRRADWALRFLNTIMDADNGDVKPTGDRITKSMVPASVVQQFRLMQDPAVIRALDKLWPSGSGTLSADRNKQVLRLTKILETGGGRMYEGQKLYVAKCGSCHRLSGDGGDIGPDLTGYDRNNVHDLLINIIDPNAYIREGYVLSYVTTTDGRTLAGSVVARDGGNLTLRTITGEPMTVSKDQIKEIKEQADSLMPEGLIDDLSDEQVRDLFTYIMKHP